MNRIFSIIIPLIGGFIAYSVLIKQNDLFWIGTVLIVLSLFDITKHLINFEISKKSFYILYSVVVLLSFVAIYLDFDSIFQRFTIMYFILLHMLLQGFYGNESDKDQLNGSKKKVLIQRLSVGVLILLYIVLAIDTYGKITELENKLDEKAHMIHNEDQIPEKERYAFNRNVSDYYKWRGTLQSFWMDGIFEFEEFEHLSET